MQQKRRESHKKVCENKYFCYVSMPSEHNKILEFNQCKKSDKSLFIIYGDLECLIGKIDGCQNNRENPSTIKVSEHIPTGFSMSTISSFESMENKHDVHRGKHCIKTFCESLREHTMEITTFFKNEVTNKRTAVII